MTQTTVLAAGTTVATSTDIVVAAGSSVTVGIYSDTADSLPEGVMFGVLQDTPGADNAVDQLHTHKRTTVLSGPGTFRVKRPALSGTGFGVFIEQ